MNLTNYQRTPLADVLNEVLEEAGKLEVEIAGTELIGLIPADAVVGKARNTPIRKLIAAYQILETRLPQ